MAAKSNGAVTKFIPGPDAITSIHGVGGVSSVKFHASVRVNWGGRCLVKL
jgi:hypothetical protein